MNYKEELDSKLYAEVEDFGVLKGLMVGIPFGIVLWYFIIKTIMLILKAF